MNRKFGEGNIHVNLNKMNLAKEPLFFVGIKESALIPSIVRLYSETWQPHHRNWQNFKKYSIMCVCYAIDVVV